MIHTDAPGIKKVYVPQEHIPSIPLKKTRTQIQKIYSLVFRYSENGNTEFVVVSIIQIPLYTFSLSFFFRGIVRKDAPKNLASIDYLEC